MFCDKGMFLTQRGLALHQLIVTADDFGLSDEINAGIIRAFKTGIVTSTSILMNAPRTEQAVQLSSENPDLEVGIHLGIVEGFSLLGRKSSLSDSLNYLDDGSERFADRICLQRHWKPFLKDYLLGRIDLSELREELTLQCESFRRSFFHLQEIPFANGTQHMHLLPGISQIVFDLCRQFNIRSLRIPGERSMGGRFPFDQILRYLGRRLRQQVKTLPMNLVTFDSFLGFEVSGKLDKSYLQRLSGFLENSSLKSPQTFELMTHPGFDAPHLRRSLPCAYKNFHWETELKALTDPGIKDLLKSKQISFIRFKDLYHGLGSIGNGI